MFDKAYEAYKKKCKELGIKPSSKKKIFGEEIESAKHNKQVSIAELSELRKAKPPTLSPTAKITIEAQTTRSIKVKKSKREESKR